MALFYITLYYYNYRARTFQKNVEAELRPREYFASGVFPYLFPQRDQRLACFKDSFTLRHIAIVTEHVQPTRMWKQNYVHLTVHLLHQVSYSSCLPNETKGLF